MAPKSSKTEHFWDQELSVEVAAPATNTRRRRVSFAGETICYPSIMRSNYTKAEFESCWYTMTEKEEMREEVKRTLKRLHRGKKCKRNSSYRGLERLVSKETETLTVHAVIDAVMDEQEVQWTNDFFAWERFSIVSRKVSKTSFLKARYQAQRDYLDALEAYREMDESSSSSSPSYTGSSTTTMTGSLDGDETNMADPPGKRLYQSNSKLCTTIPTVNLRTAIAA